MALDEGLLRTARPSGWIGVGPDRRPVPIHHGVCATTASVATVSGLR